MNKYNFKLNLSKTKIMPVRSYQRQPLKINIILQGTKLEVVNEYSLLGLKIDTPI